MLLNVVNSAELEEVGVEVGGEVGGAVGGEVGGGWRRRCVVVAD